MTASPAPIRLAVFDCDGTLVDGQANIVRAMATAFEASELPPPSPAATRAIVGLSLGEAMAVLAPAADHARLVADYKAIYAGMRAGGSLDDEPLYPGIVAALDALRGAGWRLGVATGKSDRGLAHVLARHGIADRFVTLQTADRHPSKPAPAMLFAAMAEGGALPHTSVMIGDTSFDMAMADAAGARGIGVAWGYHPPAALIAAGAEGVADTAEQLVEMLR